MILRTNTLFLGAIITFFAEKAFSILKLFLYHHQRVVLDLMKKNLRLKTRQSVLSNKVIFLKSFHLYIRPSILIIHKK